MIARGILDDLYELADAYLAVSRRLTGEWNDRSFFRRYVDNVMKLTSALQ